MSSPFSIYFQTQIFINISSFTYTNAKGGICMNFDYLSFFFINLLGLIASVVLFLGTIRFGDRILSLFNKR